MRQIYRSFGLEAPDKVIRLLAQDMADRKTIDFGRLDEELQEQVIRALYANPAERKRIAGMNPMLESLDGGQTDEALIDSNRRAIEEHYGRERITEILWQAYQSALDHPVQQRISKPALLELYLDPLRLSLAGIGNG
jgi:hypothetical protein